MITKWTTEIWRLFDCYNLGSDSHICFRSITWISRESFHFDLPKYELKVLNKSWNILLHKKNEKMIKSRFLKKSQKYCAQYFYLFEADIYLWYQSDQTISHELKLSSNNKNAYKLFHQILNNALRGLLRGNEVDGVLRGSSRRKHTDTHTRTQEHTLKHTRRRTASQRHRDMHAHADLHK